MTTPSTTPDELVERVRHALDTADLATLRDLLHPDVQWGPPGDTTWGCHGRDEVLAWYGRGRDAGVRADVAEVVTGPGKLLVGLRVRGRAADAEHGDAERWQVLTLQAGQIIDIRGFDHRPDAAAFAGLPQ